MLFRSKKDGIEVSSVSASWNDEINEGTAGEAIFRVYLPEGYGQTISYSSNVTEKDGYLEVKGNPFTISCAVTDENRMKGFPITNGIGKTFPFPYRIRIRMLLKNKSKFDKSLVNRSACKSLFEYAKSFCIAGNSLSMTGLS